MGGSGSAVLVLGLLFVGALAKPKPEQLLSPLTSYLSCGHLFYRTLHLDESRNALYVGGMDRLIKVNLANVSSTDCAGDSLLLEPSNVFDVLRRRSRPRS